MSTAPASVNSVQAARQIMGARVAMMLKPVTAFFAGIVAGMEIVEDPSVGTIGVSLTHIYYNPDFVVTLTKPEMLFALCHEAWHVAKLDPSRCGKRDRKLFNMASDYIINQALVDDNIGTAIKGVLLDQALVEQGNHTTEGDYALLQQRMDKQSGAGKQGSPGEQGDDDQDGDGDRGGAFDQLMPDKGSAADKAQAEQAAMQRVLHAAQAAKMQGHLTSSQARLVGELLNPQVPWEKRLRQFFSQRARVDRSMSRPSRRFISQGMYLASRSGERLGPVVVAVDCSGSIGARELGVFVSELAAIREDTKPERTHVMYFDSHVSRHDTFERDEDLVVAKPSTGGTAFSPIFRLIADEGITPDCVVVLTDLYCNDFGPQPDYPVMWVTTGATQAPWGDIVPLTPAA